jgi:hypothetical protein
VGEPGPWFSTRRTATNVGTESQSDVKKWSNPREELRTYEFTEDVTVYYGPVAGGKGYQILMPRGVDPADVLKHLESVPLKMKDRLLELLRQAIDPLHACDYGSQAEWFQVRRWKLQSATENGEVFQATLREVQAIIGGMGSFTDLSLTPTQGSGLTRGTAREQQCRLAEQIDAVIERLMTKGSG